MPYDKKPGAVTRMYDKKGKQVGLMVEGSMAYMDHGSAAHHAGKSKMHAKPGKDYPDDGHLHYKDGEKVESPGVSETKKLSDTSGAVGQMSPYKFTGMSGGSAFYETDPKEKQSSKDKLPSYETTTYEASASGGGLGQKTKTVSEKVYTPPKRTKAGDEAYAKLTPQQKKAQDAKYRKMATKTVTREVPVSGGQKSQEKLSTKRTTIGTQTMGQVEKAGQIQAKNRASKMKAQKEAALIQAKKDSISAANKFMKALPTDVARSSEGGRRGATRAGERAGYSYLRKSGSYDRDQAREQFNPDFGAMKYDTKVVQEKGLFKKEKKQRIKLGRDTKVGKSGGYAR